LAFKAKNALGQQYTNLTGTSRRLFCQIHRPKIAKSNSSVAEDWLALQSHLSELYADRQSEASLNQMASMVTPATGGTDTMSAVGLSMSSKTFSSSLRLNRR
jgi:hypothetical protein